MLGFLIVFVLWFFAFINLFFGGGYFSDRFYTSLFMAIFGVVIGAVVQLWIIFKDKKKISEQRIQIINYYNAPPDYDKYTSECVEGDELLECRKYGIWYKDDKLYFLVVPNGKESSFMGKRHYVEVYAEDIFLYDSVGDKHYYTETSGGSLVKTSVLGAVVGGAISGPLGAAAFGLKPGDPPKTTVTCVDLRQTIITMMIDYKSYLIVFDGNTLYEKLLSWIPEKVYFPAKNNLLVEGDGLDSENDDMQSRLEKLKVLYEKKLITEDEYNEKRSQILDTL